jgi:hypothetical protein
MNKIVNVALVGLFGFLVWIICMVLSLPDKKVPKHDTLPPGFSLICNGKWEYYPTSKTADFLWMSPMTRQGAIDRAWDHYEWKAKQDNKLTEFKPCN